MNWSEIQMFFNPQPVDAQDEEKPGMLATSSTISHGSEQNSFSCVGHKSLVKIRSVMNIVSREKTTDNIYQIINVVQSIISNNMSVNKIHSVLLLSCRGSKQLFNPMGWLEQSKPGTFTTGTTISHVSVQNSIHVHVQIAI